MLKYRADAPKIDTSPTFHKLLKRDSIYKLCLEIQEKHILILP